MGSKIKEDKMTNLEEQKIKALLNRATSLKKAWQENSLFRLTGMLLKAGVY